MREYGNMLTHSERAADTTLLLSITVSFLNRLKAVVFFKNHSQKRRKTEITLEEFQKDPA